MIRSFDGELAEALYHNLDSDIHSILTPVQQQKILRIFDHLNAISDLNKIKIPGIDNFFRVGSAVWGIKVSPDWQIVFRWFENDIYNLDLKRTA